MSSTIPLGLNFHFYKTLEPVEQTVKVEVRGLLNKRSTF